MLLSRLFPILIIGVGYLICKSIFTKYPLTKDTLANQDKIASIYLSWFLSLLIILGQIFYVVKIFSSLFKVSGIFFWPFFIIIFSVFSIYAIFFLKKR